MRALNRVRLLGPAYRGYERVRAAQLPHGPEPAAADGLPVPPPHLIVRVAGTPDVAWFLESGRLAAESIREAVEGAGSDIEDLDSILDFGCGCGRVARHWAGVEGPEIYGCDYNPELVAWCAEKLPLLRATRNELAPPAPYVSGSFDLIYALSVFSHLDEPLQRAWLAEFRRLLQPGGLLVISVLGEQLRHRLGAEERERFDRGEMVVQRPRMAGRNLCTVYHPRPYVTETLLSGFDEVRRFDLGSAVQPILQDAYVARRKRVIVRLTPSLTPIPR